jgi:hypothetical protein
MMLGGCATSTAPGAVGVERWRAASQSLARCTPQRS